MTREFNAAALQYPFQPATNRHAQDLEKRITKWVTDYYSFLPEKVKKKYTQTGMGHAGGCMFPREQSPAHRYLPLLHLGIYDR